MTSLGTDGETHELRERSTGFCVDGKQVFRRGRQCSAEERRSTGGLCGLVLQTGWSFNKVPTGFVPTQDKQYLVIARRRFARPHRSWLTWFFRRAASERSAGCWL
jgi:hypothetical protein